SGGEAAGRVLRRIEEDGPGPRRLLDEALDVVEVGAEVVGLAQRREDRHGPTPLQVGQVGGEVRREDEDGVAGIEERLAEELLEDLGAGPDDDVLRPDVDAVLAAVVAGDGLAERRQAGRGAVVRLALVDGPAAGLEGAAGAGERRIAYL